MKVLQIHCTYQFPGGEDKVVANEKRLLENGGITVEELVFNNSSHPLQKLIQAPFNLGAYFKTRNKLAVYHPDIVHIHNLHFGASPSVLLALKNAGVPFVQTLHNYRLLCPSAVLFNRGRLFLDSLKQRFPWKAISAGVYKNSIVLTAWVSLTLHFHRWLIGNQQSSKYIVLTKHAKKLYLSSKSHFQQEQFVIKPNFSSIDVPVHAKTCDHFVFVGRLSEEKGIDVLLNAFSSLPYKLKIAGDGPLAGDVSRASIRYPNIEYMGPLAENEIAALLVSGIALIFPSKWYEGMPMVIIEALACGLPVIASNIGAMEEMITDGYNGYHFEAGNTASLQKSVYSFAALSEDLKSALRSNAYETYANKYSAKRNLAELVGIYNDILHV